MTAPDEQFADRLDRLLDAIDLIKSGQRQAALPLLRDLIREDHNFEDAWLWMSVAVDNIDQSIICLDNVLRINPDNLQASGALYRLREAELASENYRARLRFFRDLYLLGLWLLAIAIVVAILITYSTPEWWQ